ncbi:MAG: heavy metal-binding domain-containing protein [Bacteroidia bacterium]
MKKVIATVAAFMFVVGITTTVNAQNEPKKEAPKKESKMEEKKETKAEEKKENQKETMKIYTCTMCGGFFDKPGKCPKCKMDLVEKK